MRDTGEYQEIDNNEDGCTIMNQLNARLTVISTYHVIMAYKKSHDHSESSGGNQGIVVEKYKKGRSFRRLTELKTYKKFRECKLLYLIFLCYVTSI